MRNGAASRGRPDGFRAPNPSESGERLAPRARSHAANEYEAEVSDRDCTMAMPAGYEAFGSTAPPRTSRPATDTDTTVVRGRGEPAATPAPAPRRSAPSIDEIEANISRELRRSRPSLNDAHELREARPVASASVRPPAPAPLPPRDMTRVRPMDTAPAVRPVSRPAAAEVAPPPAAPRMSIPSAGEINRQVRAKESRTKWLWGGGVAAMTFAGASLVVLLLRGSAAERPIAPASAPLPLAAAIAAAAPPPAAVKPTPVAITKPAAPPPKAPQAAAPQVQPAPPGAAKASAPSFRAPSRFEPPARPAAVKKPADNNSKAFELAQQQLEATL